MASCAGRIPNQAGQHSATVYRCVKCGAVGCRDHRCTSHNWSSNDGCLRCGSHGTMKPLAP
jgi:hypothetical protein